jgi:hypothetical protein
VRERSPADALRRALTLRAAAVRALRRTGLYQVDLRLAILRLRRARAALAAAGPAGTPVELANAEHVGTGLDRELALLVSLRELRINRAEAVYADLLTHHGTQAASRAALDRLPKDVRTSVAATSGRAETVAFALPIPVLSPYLLSAIPTLAPCAHGRLGADGACRTPPCPPPWTSGSRPSG